NMTPRTRTSNKEATFKVYYSKKVPKQVYFPHKRKTVRRRQSAEQDGVDKKQMEFLPDKMRKQFADTEESADEEVNAEEVPPVREAECEATPKATRAHRVKDKKRPGNDIQEDFGTGEIPVSVSNKRRKKKTALEAGRPSKVADPELVREPSRTLRRQSTMTQLADGRRPSLGVEDLDFKRPKRRLRASWNVAGTDKERYRKQRTLTQMIPGMGRLSKEELDELSDLDAELEEDQASNGRVSQFLVEQGLLDIGTDNHEASTHSIGDIHMRNVRDQKAEEREVQIEAHARPTVMLQSVEDLAEDDGEEDYQPTQFIEAPVRRPRQTPRRTATRQRLDKSIEAGTSAKSRFSLLSTPEKHRVFEIPSSQSPAESILSTQTSPHKSNRPALKERHDNAVIIAETPSKRRQVTFHQPTLKPEPPARLRKFESTIQDSEDEEASDLEDDLTESEQKVITNGTVHGQAVGADTQAILNQIDLACADAEEDRQHSSEDPDEPAARLGAYEPSPELGESWAPGVNDTNISLPTDIIPSTPPVISLQLDEDLPSTPMVIRDDSSDDEEAELEPTRPRTPQRIASQPTSLMMQHTADLDGQPVQVPCSPAADLETQQSHSSKAEQQLQNEWLSYSQYVHARAPNSSSMHAAAEAFSYNATPRLSRTMAPTASSARVQHSQATTVDEVTPKKNRTQRVFSTNTTPHRISKSQPFISPDKPPSLFIPSSFPSPSRAAMDGWSSPVVGRTQNLYGSSQVLGTLEDFSIPLPPPIEDD
ncbi:hypothetical protein EJ07DRAFT_104361, partial [Lizonia empirigonia]